MTPRFAPSCSPLSRRLLVAVLLGCAMPLALAKGELNVVNWSDWFIGPQAVEEFARAEDIKVTYNIIDSDDTLQAKLLTGHSGFDVVYPSSTYFAKQIEAKVYQEIDWSKIPNRVNLDPALIKKLAEKDPGNRYGVPYIWGTDGMVVNVTRAREVLGKDARLDSWDLLFKPEVVSKLHACGVSLVDQASDVFPVVLAYMGRDPNSNKVSDYKDALEVLRKVRPYIDQFSTTYMNDVAGGDMCISFAWSGDAGMIKRRAAQAHQKFELRYITPKGQTGLWFTIMGIPKDSPNKDNAYRWINHMLDTKIAAGITNTINYATAVPAASSLIRPELLKDTTIFPPESESREFFVFAPMDSAVQRAMTKMWLEFKAGR